MKKQLLATLGTLAILGALFVPSLLFAKEALTVDTLGAGKKLDDSLVLGSRPIEQTVGSIINVALGLLGLIATCIILYGGFLWMISGGEEKKVGAAKQWIIQGIIGLVIILSAWAISSFVIKSLVTATSGTGAAV